MKPGYRILEHTADVGIEAWGATVEECFEQAAFGMVEILGAKADGQAQGGAADRVSASGSDRGALLVDFLNELLLLHETRDVAFAGLRVTRVSETELEGEVDVVPLRGETETTGVKAATYHRLEVGETPDGWRARVYLDV